MENTKVLIVDDDITICSLLETILSMENYKTSSVNDVDEEKGIFPLLETEKPQILILDFHLSSQETLGYVEQIRGNVDWKELTILMTSAIDRQSVCIAAGANDFILKPFNWQDFTVVVKNLSTPN
ncbi:response regulator [Anaerolineales bacterium HSG6]|nr:response regulator [Anaerolineales bacterium HSG6]MDM8531578.1 response regulator [Anaerolineales bacterium HSG25]